MNKSEIYNSIIKEYEELQKKSKDIFDEKKAICYKTCPRIEEIDREIQLSSIEASKKVIFVEREEKEKILIALEEKQKKLREEKKQLLRKYGLNTIFLDGIYNCKKCKDTGILDGERCDCFKRKLTEKYFEMSNVKNNKERFNPELFSDELVEGEKLSPRENARLILKKCDEFVKEFDNPNFKNLLFYGSEGLGKTLLSNQIAYSLFKEDKTVLYSSATKLFDMFDKEKFNKDDELSNKDILELTYLADLVVIDDLGSEFISNLSISRLFDIINQRLIKDKSTIISTNLSPDDLKNIYSNRIVSRIYGNYKVFKFYGTDFRLKKHLDE